MGRFDKEFKAMGGTEGLSDAYTKQKKLLTTQRREPASSELRYMFYGAVLPAHIEEEAKLLRRNFHGLEQRKGKKIDDGDYSLIVQAIGNDPIEEGVKKHINFQTADGNNDAITIHETTNPERGTYPMTRFTYDDKPYTSLPFHGDVLNHTFEQHSIVVKSLLKWAIKEGILSPENAMTYEYFHLGHDIDEISPQGKDQIEHEKTNQQKNRNSKKNTNNTYKTMLENAEIFSQEQIDFSNKLFHLLDNKQSLIGSFEKIIYMLTALDTYVIKDSINSGPLLSLAVLRNNIDIFKNQTSPNVTMHNIIGEGDNSTIPFNQIQYTKDFWKKNHKTIEKIIKHVDEEKNNFDDGALQYLYSGLAGSDKKQRDTQSLRAHLDEVIISLKKSVETIKREQDSVIL